MLGSSSMRDLELGIRALASVFARASIGLPEKEKPGDETAAALTVEKWKNEEKILVKFYLEGANSTWLSFPLTT
jgi:hypothetical protein